MGQLITVTVRRGRVAVGAHLRPQPLAHRHGDRAVPVGRGGEGRDRPPDVLARRLFDLGADVGDRVLELGGGRPHRPSSGRRSSRRSIETIEHLFGYYGDDAGWSPDTLRAIGVEPLPTPEPTA